jgi:repressor LexA
MTNQLTLPKDLADHLVGQRIASVDVHQPDQLILHFVEGATLGVTWSPNGLLVQMSKPITKDTPIAANRPTKRQLDYLLFIRKYLTRYGRAPAESDIERHFMVSAPSVNQMMQMLERRGFITRQPGVPRSARICIDLDGQR